jgi:carboxylesterase
MNQNLIIPTAEPFFFPGGTTGIVLVHGFTGSPKEMRGLGLYLHQKGHTTLGVRLTGHATQPVDLARTRWWDWLCTVEDGLNLLKGHCLKVFIVGLSLGGILSLVSAARYSFDGAAALATPYSLPKDWRMKIAKPLSFFYPQVKKKESDLRDQVALDAHVDYPTYPTRAIAELNGLIKILHTSLPSIKMPLLLINSKNDRTIPIDHSYQINNRVESKDVTQIFVEESSHVLTEDIDKDQVFFEVERFIALHNK